MGQEVPEKPFLKGTFKEALDKVRKAFTPSMKMTMAVERRKKLNALQKKEAASRVFGSGKIGCIIIRPELYAHSSAIRKFLEKQGFQTVHSQSITYNKALATANYPQANKYLKKFENFSLFLANAQAGPNRVLFFTLPEKNGQKKLEQLKAGIRENFSKPNLNKHGVNPGKEMDEVGRNIDALGYSELQKSKGKDSNTHLTGVHVPVGKEIIRDVLALFSLEDIKNVEKSAKRKGLL